MGGLLLRLRTWWETADRTQKAVTIFGSVFLVLLLSGTFYFASKPHMALAYSHLDMAEVGTVTDEITKMGIKVDYDTQGNVSVPSDKVAEVQAKLAEAGKLPAPGHMGSDSLDKIGVINTKSVEDARLLKIAETDIAQAIQGLNGVERATVAINTGDKSPFADEQKPATASVEVTLAPNQMLGSDRGRVIAMLVANAVSGLSPEKVFVADNSGNTLYDGSKEGTADGTGTQKIAMEIKETNRRERDLQQALDATFGRGNTLVKVNLELNYDKKTVQEIVHPQSKAVEVENSTKETMTGDGVVPPAGGLGGAAANITPKMSDKTTPGKGYVGTTTSKEHPVDVTNTETDVAPGGIKSMAITTLVNNVKIPDKAPVEDFINGYMKSLNTTAVAGAASAFTETTTETKFDTAAQDAAASAQKESAGRDRMQQLISMLPIGALLFVGFLVVRAITKASKYRMVAALPGGGTLSLDPGRPERAAMEADHQGLEAGDHDPASQVDLIQERLNLPLEKIKRLSDERSESVAMLIKSWMMEDHR